MTARVLIITDHLTQAADLFEAVRSRADRGPATFRLVATNPERAEFHLRHAERHEGVERSQPPLHRVLDELTLAAGGPVTGEVSIRHDAFEAVEEDLLARPADEVIVAVHERDLAHRLHHDLAHRLAHLHVGVTAIESPRGPQPIS